MRIVSPPAPVSLFTLTAKLKFSRTSSAGSFLTRTRWAMLRP
nr:hypothetical protein I308_06790 [Cryptococcus tetragattii IND107]